VDLFRDENAYTTAIRSVAEILQDYDYGEISPRKIKGTE
jgi:hypothetical protein